MNSIHPSAIITGDVSLGAGNTIGAHAVITGPLVIGDDNWIGTGVIIGAPPEVRSWPHPRDALQQSSGNGVVIGSGNVIREFAQVHQGWKGTTTLGDGLFIMNQAYVAHDCLLGDGVTLASSVLLAGHAILGEKANLGLGTVVHQRVFIGGGAMVGMGSVVTRDVPPFAKAYGNPARVRGVNSVGMERSGVRDDAVELLADLYSHDSLDAERMSAAGSFAGLESSVASWLKRPGA